MVRDAVTGRGGEPADDGHGRVPAHAGRTRIGCTLERIQAASNGRMKIEIAGRSVQDRPLYLVTIDDRSTEALRTASDNYAAIHATQLSDPVASMARSWRRRAPR